MTALKGPTLDLATYERSQIQGKKAKRLSSALKDVRHEIVDLRAERGARQLRRDPLTWSTAMRLQYRRNAHEAAEDTQRAEEATDRRAATRATLSRAARVARRLGYWVRPSKDRAGRISSYYLDIVHAHVAVIRISDHDLPTTPERNYMARCHGRLSHDGYHGPELIIDAPHSATWLRRAIVLTAGGRCVPGLFG